MATDESNVSHDYFSLDDILSVNSNVPCTLQDSIDHEFFPLVGLPKPTIIDSKGIKAEVPLWMVHSIKDHCEISIPKAYNTAVQTVLLSNASSVNLEGLQQYFYFVGLHLADLLESEEGKSLTDCLLETLVQRIGDVVSKALQGQNKPGKIDNMEKCLFDDILRWRTELTEWMSGGKPISNKRKLT